MTGKHWRVVCGLMGLAVCLLMAMEIVAEPPQVPPKSPPPKQNSDEAKSKSLQDFMRAKLSASEKILEGLALEDLELVQQGAQSLHQMSSAEKWRVSKDATYRQFSEEFQRNTGELARAAENDNLDLAALKWFATTMNCIECHRFVRNNLMVK